MLRNRLRDLILLPIALVVIVFEDLIWAGALAVLRWVLAWPPVRRLAARMALLPPWAALLAFAVPEIISRLFELWFFVLLARGDMAAAAVVFVAGRLIGTLVAVFVYHSCEAALMRIGWFAWMIRTALAIRDWARSIVAPMIVRVRGWIRRDRVRMLRRVQELRWAILAWMSGRQGLGPRTDEKPQPKRRR